MKAAYALLFAIAATLPAFPQKALDAETAIARFGETVRTVNDYQCRLYEWCGTGLKYEKRIINYYFSRPRKIRMDIVSGNRPFDGGSVGIYTGGQTVDGRKGGLLSGVVLTVGMGDAAATTALGVRFDESDLAGILEKINKLKKNSRTAVEFRGGSCWLFFDLDEPAPKWGITREIIVLDTVSWLPVYSESWRGKTQIQQARWTGYIVNRGLPEGLFEIRRDSSLLSSQGLPDIAEIPVDERNFTYE